MASLQVIKVTLSSFTRYLYQRAMIRSYKISGASQRLCQRVCGLWSVESYPLVSVDIGCLINTRTDGSNGPKGRLSCRAVTVRLD